MNLLKNIASIVLLLLLAFCTNQSSEKSRDGDYTNAELIGKWNQVSADKSLNDTDPKINFIQLVNDSIAEVQIIESTGERKVYGNWKNRFKKEIKKLNIKIESDIKITYSLDDHQIIMLLLDLGEENEKLIMTVKNYKFKKV